MQWSLDHVASACAFILVVILVLSFAYDRISAFEELSRRAKADEDLKGIFSLLVLNPGSPEDWGASDALPAVLGLKDPERGNYWMSAFSLSRLDPGRTVSCSRGTFSYLGADGVSWSLQSRLVLNYSYVKSLLPAPQEYDFHITVEPAIEVSVSRISSSPLSFSVTAIGDGGPLVNASVALALLEPGEDLSVVVTVALGRTGSDGSITIAFPKDEPTTGYVLLAQAELAGVRGEGVFVRRTGEAYVLPLVTSLSWGEILLAHSSQVGGPSGPALSYVASYLSGDSVASLQVTPLDSGTLETYASISNPLPSSPGIIAVAYSAPSSRDIVLLPWGTLPGFSISFGPDPSGKPWTATASCYATTYWGPTYKFHMVLWEVG